MARISTVATLYAVAASKFDLTGTPYDLIIRLSAEKPACGRGTYWPRPARHYRGAGNDARASRRVENCTRLCRVQILIVGKFNLRSSPIDPATGSRLAGNQLPIFQGHVSSGDRSLYFKAVSTVSTDT